MPENQPIGTIFVWVILTFLSICLFTGGTFLMLYMTQPVTPDTSWYPRVGIGLVCLPWFFWILLFLYRILSRTFGFRMVCWGTGGLPVESVHAGTEGGTTAKAEEGLETGSSYITAENPSSRHTTFVEETSRDEHDNHKGGSQTSAVSHESEVPLRSSMQT